MSDILWRMVLGEISPSLRGLRDVAVRKGKQWALLAYLKYLSLTIFEIFYCTLFYVICI